MGGTGFGLDFTNYVILDLIGGGKLVAPRAELASAKEPCSLMKSISPSEVSSSSTRSGMVTVLISVSRYWEPLITPNISEEGASSGKRHQ